MVVWFRRKKLHCVLCYTLAHELYMQITVFICLSTFIGIKLFSWCHFFLKLCCLFVRDGGYEVAACFSSSDGWSPPIHRARLYVNSPAPDKVCSGYCFFAIQGPTHTMRQLNNLSTGESIITFLPYCFKQSLHCQGGGTLKHLILKGVTFF